MDLLGKRVRDVFEFDAIACKAIERKKKLVDKKYINKNNTWGNKRRAIEKRMEKKKIRLQKAKELVVKLNEEVSKDLKELSEGKDLLDKIKQLKEDTDAELESYKTKIYKQIKPIVMDCKDEFGLYILSDDECMICCDKFPFVVNACTSETCKYVMCLECYVMCKDKCPNCRNDFKKK